MVEVPNSRKYNFKDKLLEQKLKVKFYKAYSQLNIESFKHFVDESEKQGLKVVGHIPNTFEDQTEKLYSTFWFSCTLGVL
jgi:hypothetical protein